MSHRKGLRQIVAETGIAVPEARRRIEADRREAPHPQKLLEGRELREVRIALRLVARPRGSGIPAERFTEKEPGAPDALSDARGSSQMSSAISRLAALP